MRRLIVNADDYGLSQEVNSAVIDAHQRGILTTASLMVNGSAFGEAAQLARENPDLGVGLHVALAFSKSTLPAQQIPNLADREGNFSNDPVRAGMQYFFNKSARQEMELEIAAQFEKFASTGLPCDHVNGHLHFHLHPAVFPIVMQQCERFGVKRMRLTRDPFWLNARIASGRWFYRTSHSVIFRVLSNRVRTLLQNKGIRFTTRVFGLLQNAEVGEAYLKKLISRLPDGDSEIYSHPSLRTFANEYEALISPAIVALIRQQNIQLIRYQDL